jgi:uncharacterized membrane protein YphA (DoxX/SURF4 family)
MNILLWILQILLALLFLFSGAVKLVLPVEEMTKQMPVHLPGLFLRFIGVCEILGGIGLILPALLRIKPWLTPLAAAGLLIILIGAIAIGLMSGTIGPAILPFVVALLIVFVIYGRWRLAPIANRIRG